MGDNTKFNSFFFFFFFGGGGGGGGLHDSSISFTHWKGIFGIYYTLCLLGIIDFLALYQMGPLTPLPPIKIP